MSRTEVRHRAYHTVGTPQRVPPPQRGGGASREQRACIRQGMHAEVELGTVVHLLSLCARKRLWRSPQVDARFCGLRPEHKHARAVEQRRSHLRLPPGEAPGLHVST